MLADVERGNPFGHIDPRVSSMDEALPFYEALLPALGFRERYDGPKWKVFAKIRMPNAYPYILSALKVTATAAVVGAIVGEFVASQRGLGYVIITTQSSMNTPVAFAALAWISILGLVLFAAVSGLSRLLVPWAEKTPINS